MLGQCVCTAVGTTWIRGKNAHKLLTQNSDHVVGNEIIRAYSLKWIELAGNSDSESIYAKEWSELAIYTFPPTDLLHYIVVLISAIWNNVWALAANKNGNCTQTTICKQNNWNIAKTTENRVCREFTERKVISIYWALLSTTSNFGFANNIIST